MRTAFVVLLVIGYPPAAAPSYAAVFTWDGGTGSWDTATLNWNGGTATWPASGTDHEAVFAGTPGTVSIAVGGVAANRLSFNAHGYLITGDPLTLNGATPTIDVTTGVTTITAPIAGSDLFRTGGGSSVLYLSGNNSYGGNTYVNAGFLVAQHGNALGTAGNSHIAAGATLQLENNITIANETAYIVGDGVGGTRGALASWTGNNVWGGAVVLTGDSRIFVNSGSMAINNTISETIAGANLVKSGGGTLTLGGTSANTYTGTTILIAGNLVLSKLAGVVAIPGDVVLENPGSPNLWFEHDNQIGSGSILTFTGSEGHARFNVFGTSQTLAGLVESSGTRRGVVQNSEAVNNAPSTTNPGTLTLNGSGTYSFDGYLRDQTGQLALVKQGAGTQTLAGNQITYSGATTVSNGTLKFSDTTALNTSIHNDATVEINAAAGGDSWILAVGRTLSGSGTWIKTGEGRATLRNATLTTSGQFLIQQGTLRNDHNAGNWSGSTADVDISAGAILDLYADAVYVNRLTGSGFVQNGFGNGSGHSGLAQYIEKLVVGVADGSSTFSGIIRNNATGTAPAGGTAGGGIQLDKVGTGTLSLTGNNTYSGATTIDGGTLQIGAGGTTGTLGTGAVIITAPGNLTFDRSNDYAVSNTISGSGSLTQAGSGKVTLSGGGITYTGATTVNEGILSLSVTTNYASSTVVNHGATLELAGTANAEHGSWTGNALTLNDGATLHKSNTGYDTMNYGNLIVDGNVSINIANNGSNNQLFVGGQGGTGLTGAGTIAVTNTGGANTGLTLRYGVHASRFAGAMTVAGGALNIGSGAGLTLENADLTLTDARLTMNNSAFAASGATNVSLKSLAGNAASSVVLGAQTLTIGINNGTGGLFGGTMGGTGGLSKVGPGTQTLAGGGITYTGPTTVHDGTLVVQDTINFASAAAVQSGATLEAARTALGLANRRPIMGNAVTGSGTININNAGSGIGGGWTIVNGGPGSLDFSGTININSGVFARDNTQANTIAGTATVNVAAGAAFGAGRGGNSTIGALNGAGVVSTLWSGSNAGSLTLGNGGASGHFSGTIHGNGTSGSDGTLEGGRLSLIKTGTGTQTLSGNNTFAGNVTVDGGTLRGSAVNAFGAANSARTITVNSGATLEFNRVGMYGGHNSAAVPHLVINAGGTVSNTSLNNPLNNVTLDGGTLTATASNTATWRSWNINGTITSTGNSFINGGTAADPGIMLQSAAVSNTNIHVTGGNLTISAPIVNGRFGSGWPEVASRLTKIGGGTLTLSGNNTYSGGTTVNDGTLVLGGTNNGASRVGSGLLTINSGAIVEFAALNPLGWNNSAVTPSVEINDGTLDAKGFHGSFRTLTLNSGTVTRTGGFWYFNQPGSISALSGTSTIAGGQMQLRPAGGAFMPIDVAAGAGLNISTVLANDSGPAGFEKRGGGTLTLSGASTYTGGTIVNGGTLLVTGSLGNTAVAVNGGGVLAGTGRIDGKVTINSGGLLSPGTSPGVLTLGELALDSGSTTFMEIDGLLRGAEYDGIDIVANDGLAYGGTLSLAFMTGLLPAGSVFDLFRFTGDASGAFEEVVSTGSYAGMWEYDDIDTFALAAGWQTLLFSHSTGNLTVVPEPGTWPLLLMALVVGLSARRWRRHA